MVAALPLLGRLWIVSVGNGVDRYPAGSPQRAMAEEALRTYYRSQSNPVVPGLAPRVRVARVWRDAGHCTGPGQGEPLEEWRATVRAHTWFGLPLVTMRLTCGGWQWKAGMLMF